MLFYKDKMDSVRVVVAVMAAVMSGGGALYGVYVKARSESRTDTAASYETLAPEINELKREVQELKNEKEALKADREPAQEEDPPMSRKPRAVARRAPETPAPVSTPERPAIPSEAPSTPPPPAEQSPDIVDGIKGKIPIDFEQAEKLYKQIRSVKKS